MYGLSGWGLNVVVSCRFTVVGFLLTGLSGCRVVVVTGGGGGGATVCVGAGSLAGTWPAGGPAATYATANFRSREAMAFATSAQTIAAAISVAASRKNLRQFIDCETATRPRMLRHQSTRRSTIMECDSSFSSSPARN